MVMLDDEIAKNMQMGKQTDLILLDFILEIWEKRWDMSLNPSKYQVLNITA